MLFIGIFTIIMAIPIFAFKITPSLWNRITTIILLYSALLSLNGLHTESLASGVGIYNGLFTINILTISTEIFILFTGSIIILGWAPINTRCIVSNISNTPSVSEYSIFILFTCLGATLLISSSDLISIYLSLELQSFAVYILATIYRHSESSTSAGLKYYLLGGLSSAFILLGTAIIYSYTGITQFESLYTIIQVPGFTNINDGITWGILFIGIGFLFKISAAPLHNWAPDVYDGVPTIITIWLTTIPKISLLIFILLIQSGLKGNNEYINVGLSIYNNIDVDLWKNILLIFSVSSLIIGTVVGLSQYRIKRLLAYSTISHIGFILLALQINSEQSIESFIFYIAQYSITNVNIFITVLAFGYVIKRQDIVSIDELKGQFKINPILSVSLSICLFSIAGIPPIIGFFAKQMVLYSSILDNNYFMSVTAIIVSVISAFYYLKIVRTIFFDNSDEINTKINSQNISNVHSFIISILTIIITLFVIQPNIILNSTQIIALSLFNN